MGCGCLFERMRDAYAPRGIRTVLLLQILE